MPLLQRNLEEATASAILSWALETYGAEFAISTSFQAEGMVIVDMAARLDKKPRIITLDTGRLPAETYQMIETVRERYGIAVEMIFPDAAEVESMVVRHGPNLFYQETAKRMLCCNIRKVRPLDRKLRELKAWAVGLRRDQSESRGEVLKVDLDARPVKITPLADWTRQQVDDYIRLNDVPLHPLYARRYSSIGCDPCTRAIEAGESERAGRWWWEQDADKECGIHFTADGKAQRTVDVLLEQVLEAGVHKGCVLWFTGLSGAGKSTISNLIEARLRAAGAKVEVLDGDVVRTHLSKGLGFSKEHRDINVRRIGFVAELLARHGVVVIVAAISPYRAVREEVRSLIPNFVEVYVECPIEVLAERDVKGLYKKALAGEIANFTGVTDPYEPPLNPEVAVNSSRETPEESAGKIWATLERLGLISFDRPTHAH